MIDCSPAAGQRRLQPRERVVIFKDDPSSGATLGYYGTVLDIHTSSIQRHPDSPEHWSYTVLIYGSGDRVDVVAGDLFAPGMMNFDHLPPDSDTSKPAFEIRVHGEIGKLCKEIRGAYRFLDREWRLFTFRKRDSQCPAYKLTFPLPGQGPRVANLEYSVPYDVNLDQSFIFQAIADLTGTECEN